MTHASKIMLVAATVISQLGCSTDRSTTRRASDNALDLATAIVVITQGVEQYHMANRTVPRFWFTLSELEDYTVPTALEALIGSGAELASRLEIYCQHPAELDAEGMRLADICLKIMTSREIVARRRYKDVVSRLQFTTYTVCPRWVAARSQ